MLILNILLKILWRFFIDGTHNLTNSSILKRRCWQTGYWFSAVNCIWFTVLMTSFLKVNCMFDSLHPLIKTVLRSWLLFRISQLSKMYVQVVLGWLKDKLYSFFIHNVGEDGTNSPQVHDEYVTGCISLVR